MRKALVLSAIMIACLELNAQSIDRSVVSASGTEFTTSVGVIANTIGEPLTNTLVGGTATFTQGFHTAVHLPPLNRSVDKKCPLKSHFRAVT